MEASDWFDLAQVVVGLGAVIVAIVFSLKGLRLAQANNEATLDMAKRELDQAAAATREQLAQNWELVGSDMAANWRRGVMDLYERGLSADEIREVLATELGVEWDDSGRRLNSEANGDIDLLVERLDAAARRGP